MWFQLAMHFIIMAHLLSQVCDYSGVEYSQAGHVLIVSRQYII